MSLYRSKPLQASAKNITDIRALLLPRTKPKGVVLVRVMENTGEVQEARLRKTCEARQQHY